MNKQAAEILARAAIVARYKHIKEAEEKNRLFDPASWSAEERAAAGAGVGGLGTLAVSKLMGRSWKDALIDAAIGTGVGGIAGYGSKYIQDAFTEKPETASTIVKPTADGKDKSHLIVDPSTKKEVELKGLAKTNPELAKQVAEKYRDKATSEVDYENMLKYLNDEKTWTFVPQNADQILDAGLYTAGGAAAGYAGGAAIDVRNAIKNRGQAAAAVEVKPNAAVTAVTGDAGDRQTFIGEAAKGYDSMSAKNVGIVNQMLVQAEKDGDIAAVTELKKLQAGAGASAAKLDGIYQKYQSPTFKNTDVVNALASGQINSPTIQAKVLRMLSPSALSRIGSGSITDADVVEINDALKKLQQPSNFTKRDILGGIKQLRGTASLGTPVAGTKARGLLAFLGAALGGLVGTTNSSQPLPQNISTAGDM